MRNLFQEVQSRTKELSKKQSNTFNTNDFLLEVLLNKKIKRQDVIDLIIVKRLELMNIDLETIESKELDSLINKLFKTSKNGLDTSVSDSNNNSSFSYNTKYSDYKLNKVNNELEIIKIKK